MQCKARKRQCTFSKDGAMEIQAENDSTEQQHSPSSTNSRPPSPAPKKIQRDQKQMNAAIQVLNRLNKAWPGEGKEGKWELDQNKLRHDMYNLEPADNEINNSSLLPARSTQQRLVQLYYKHCYSIFPIVPKRLFLKQFESPIKTNNPLPSPLLLLVMFAHAAHQNKEQEEADGYFRLARTALLDDYVDKPSLSTVISLVLMCLYESEDNVNPTMYSALAYQMCLDLELIRNYNGNIESDLKELRKRVCWGCYILDKLMHIQSGQPWFLRSKDIELDMPLLLPGDDVTEHGILESFVSAIRLLQIAERVLQPESLHQVGQPIIRTHTHDQMSFDSKNELLQWLRSLPSHLQWTPSFSTTYAPTTSTHTSAPANGMVAHIHLLYNYIELCVLKPYATSTVKSIHARSAAVASNLTRIVSCLAENSSWILNHSFTVNGLFESIKIHLRDCACENMNLARHARFMFQQSMHTLKSFLSEAKTEQVTYRIVQFVTRLDQAINEADTNSMFSDDIMTPFVLGSLNTRYGEEERQQWSKLDYFANGLVTPPTVKSKSIQMSSTMFASPAYGHNSLFDQQEFWKIRNNPLDFLSNSNTVESWRNSNHKSPSVNNSPKPPAYHSDLLLNQSHSTDIAALVAQIQDKSNTSNEDWSTSSSNTTPITATTSAPPITTTAVTSTTTTTASSSTTSTDQSENDSLLYSLLSRQTPTRRPSEQKQHSTFVQPYMNVGLGIYASAHQHHNDVIRQHLPVTTNRPVTMTTQPQEPQ
ncbi:fungal-specific transcription factor domain-containing protein [Gilbertella persicaria]|uniref:fungal-specific transcription factor domain-containing protein n=1 Tax=Gilbertella persicaria TaxID=101096 RepID=UPI00221E6CEE|nr:fungal-specific transcription factor domain-containing protein [Gilbertella persicaria]KAI8090284.1 fungal-specific transcription factor domain-containing protein [Gilbertella persicaria]